MVTNYTNSTIIVGYIGQHNTGDDAFLLSSVFGVEHFLAPQKKIYALSSIVPYTSGIPVKTIYPPYQFRGSRFLYSFFADRCFKKSNNVIFAGGSIFHTTKSLKNAVALLDMLKPGLRFAVGVSIGPFKDPDAPNACASLLSRLDFIGVRDQISLERVKSICPTANVKLTFDLAPLLPYFSNFKQAKQREGGRLGVSLCNNERFVGGNRNNETVRIICVAEALNKAFKTGALKELILLDFNGHKKMGDHQIHRTLANLVDDRIVVTHYPYSNNPLDFLGIISSLDALIGMRLHSNVFSFCVETPTIMFAYHEKCYEWSRLIGIPSAFIFDSQGIDPEKLSKSIQGILSNPEKATPLKLTFKEAVSLSLKNWTWITEE